jgi:hypothetical protein
VFLAGLCSSFNRNVSPNARQRKKLGLSNTHRRKVVWLADPEETLVAVRGEGHAEHSWLAWTRRKRLEGGKGLSEKRLVEVPARYDNGNGVLAGQ